MNNIYRFLAEVLQKNRIEEENEAAGQYRFFIRHRVCLDSVMLLLTAALLGALVVIAYGYLDHDRVCYEVRKEQLAEDARRKAVFAAELAAQNERIAYRKKLCAQSTQDCKIISTEWGRPVRVE